LLLVAFSGALHAVELPARFSLPPPDSVIRKGVEPRKFAESVGRRSAILGREDGTFEVWINPVKVLRDFRMSIFFDGALEGTPLADFAERLHAAPGRTTIIHSHAAFTIRQTWIAPLDRPAAIVLLEIDTDRPLKLRASFIPELKPMWPASFGGQSSAWSQPEHMFILSEGLRRHAAVIGSPAFARASEQVGHQLPDRTVLVEMDVTPELAKSKAIPIIITESSKGADDAREIYRQTLDQLAGIVSASTEYYRGFDQRTFRLETPEPQLNDALHWAKFAIEKGWACNEGVGCGLVAGYAPSGASERPGFAWYFGGDAFMNSWSIVDYGDFERARGVLEFLRDHQRADGKMMHELTQSAALLDWSRYPYGYYHADTTPLYLISASRYVERSGDLDFAKKSWNSLQKAYRFCLTAVDSDGLMSNKKAGAAAVETGALSGRVEKDVYLEGVWIAALDGYAKLARRMGDEQQARDAESRAATARASLEGWFSRSKPWLVFGRLVDGSTYDAQSSWQGLALAWAGLDAEKTRRAVEALSRPELSTPWGARLFATDSPNYDPLSYNDGSVWPFVTSFVNLAEFQHHLASAGLQRLFGVASVTGLSGAGFLTEYLSGEREQALPRAVPHQLFSSSAVVMPAISGLLGLEGNAFDRTVRFAPHIPMAWQQVRFENYRVGQSLVSGEITNEPGATRVRMQVTGPPLNLIAAPAFPPDAKLAGLLGNNLQPQPQEAGVDLHVPVMVNNTDTLEVTYRFENTGPYAPVVLTAPEPGDAAPKAQ
jgi:glycogen debranching enzyme